MKKTVLKWELVGIIFIIILGTILHFVYDWSGHSKLVAVFGAVNESVWEHLKIGVWPAVIFALIEYFYISKKTYNFNIAKASAAYIIPVTIVILYYLYKTILGKEILVLDISIFIIAVATGQHFSKQLLQSGPLGKSWERVGLVALVLIAVVFVLGTFYPPHWGIFIVPGGKT